MTNQLPHTLGGLLAHARHSLAEAGIADCALEARLIVEHFTHTTRIDAIAAPERRVRTEEVEAVVQAIGRRLAGWPVHRLLGYREFYGLNLHLSPATLEPRPDTETLVDLVLPYARQIVARQGSCRILDLGTGTGAIALALLSAIPEAQAIGVDICERALETARANAELNGYSQRFGIVKSNWLDSVTGEFHVVVSNPPYIRTDDLEHLEPAVRDHDPGISLDGGPDGLSAYRTIAASVGKHIAEDGFIAVETGYDQKAAVEVVFKQNGFRLKSAARDLGGRDRAMAFCRPGEDSLMEKRLGKV